jgi:uncharacterized YccA/Bax inhibitor family protein
LLSIKIITMAIFKSGNPALNEKTFQKSVDMYDADVVKMTQKGTMNKFFLLFLLVIGTASFAWKAFNDGQDVFPWMLGGLIGGAIVALIMYFKPMWGSVLAPMYALFEGAFIGGISAMYSFSFSKDAPPSSIYGGIVFQAVGLTFCVVIAMFALYRFRVIRATETFKAVVITATAGIAIFYLISLVLRLAAGIDIPLLHESSPIGIGFSLLVVAIAALNLILDFDRIEQGAAMGAPKYMEWYGAFGLLVTIVWLYLEILRLLAKLQRR